MMRRLLLITYSFPPDNVPAAARPGQLSKYLPDYGYQPIVVAANDRERSRDSELVHRVPVSGSGAAASLASTLARWFTRFCSPYEDRLSWAPHAVSGALQMMESQSIDAIYSTSPFLTSHFAAFWLKIRFGLPWIADFQDPMRDNPFRTRRWVYPYDAIVERSFFSRAERLIANTDTVAAAWRERYPQWGHKVSVLWNSFDPREPIEASPPGIRSYRVLAHIGSLYGGRHPAQLLASVERLNLGRSVACIKLVGPIDPTVLAAHGALFQRLCDQGVLKYGNRSVPRIEALRETAAADYLVLLDINERNASFQVPSKLLDYIRVGKPILAYTAMGSPVERILARCGISHVTIDPSAPIEAGDQKLREFLRLPPEPAYPSAWFNETFSAQTQARTVAELLDAMLGKGALP